jgi:hypothetical protein
VNGGRAGRQHRPVDLGFAWLINYISTFATLKPGDLIWTEHDRRRHHRNPSVWLKPGDVVESSAGDRRPAQPRDRRGVAMGMARAPTVHAHETLRRPQSGRWSCPVAIAPSIVRSARS